MQYLPWSPAWLEPSTSRTSPASLRTNSQPWGLEKTMSVMFWELRVSCIFSRVWQCRTLVKAVQGSFSLHLRFSEWLEFASWWVHPVSLICPTTTGWLFRHSLFLDSFKFSCLFPLFQKWLRGSKWTSKLQKDKTSSWMLSWTTRLMMPTVSFMPFPCLSRLLSGHSCTQSMVREKDATT